jgi:hypothetical protein
MLRRHRVWGAFPLVTPEPWPWPGTSSLYDFLIQLRQASALAGEPGLRMLHRQHVLYSDPKEIALLLEHEILFRNRAPQALLKRLDARATLGKKR